MSPLPGAAAPADLTIRGIGRLLTMTGEPVPDAAVVTRAGRV